MAISTKTLIYMSKPLEMNDNRYAIKNNKVKTSPMTISRGPVDRKIKKKGNIQKTIHAYILNHGYLGKI